MKTRPDREDKAAIVDGKQMFRQWRENHMLKTVETTGPHSRKPVVVIDQPANQRCCSTLLHQVVQRCREVEQLPGRPSGAPSRWSGEVDWTKFIDRQPFLTPRIGLLWNRQPA
jgi:hypothetical protein